MWSGVGIPKTETKGRSHRCCYATPHELITSYRLPNKKYFAFISHCFMSDCKVGTCIHFVSVWDEPFPAPTFYRCMLWLLWFRTIPLQHKQFNMLSYNEWLEGDRKGCDTWKGAMIKFIINTILHFLGYWLTIGLYFIRYKRKLPSSDILHVEK